MNDKVKEWKPVVGYEGLYLVSDSGEVVSNKDIKSYSVYIGNERPLRSIQTNKHGYSVVALSKDGKKKLLSVHRIVAEAFIPNTENKLLVNHKNGIKTDNRVENLEWCKASENQLHSYAELGRVTPNRLLTKEQIFEVLSQTCRGYRDKLAIKFNVKASLIKNVRLGVNYKKEYKEFVELYGKPKLTTKTNPKPIQ